MNPAGFATNPTGPDAHEDARPSGAAVAAIHHVILPPFWPNSPSTWFLQVEAHFRLRQITSQQTRYWHPVSCLAPDVADDLADILASPHPSHLYNTLKAAIISCKFESEHSRVQQLITATELGDRRPTQLLRRMRQLLGGPSAPQEEKLLCQLFLQRLPQSMVPVLAAAGDVPVDTLAEMADRVADYSRAHSLNDVTTLPLVTTADRALASIENRLDAFVRRLDHFVPAHRRPSSRFQIHSRSSTPPRSPDLQPTDAPRDVSSSTLVLPTVRQSTFLLLFCEALRSNETLTCLRLSQCDLRTRITACAIFVICRLLGTQLRELTLDSLQLVGDVWASLEVLRDGLAATQTLKMLKVVDVHVTGTGAGAAGGSASIAAIILDGLAGNTSVCSLAIDSWFTMHDNEEAFQRLLADSTSLIELSVTCARRCHEASAVFDALAANSSITDLIVEGFHLGQPDGESFAELLARNKALKEVSFTDCSWDLWERNEQVTVRLIL
ncbi:hypothetical protein HPB51_004000 [Rhipicephalus microplus]|uniref:DUF7041 domain-containing protein n=1 Tax=Rhipicephalus microplus TaxID=6941 RepID=A0A9J6DT77_RHIMP|nr:hypothetical protein HPB51_004000 [Rhipicephalus microplus]